MGTGGVEEAAVGGLKRRPDVIGVSYWMDMALSNAVGIPTVAFGPAGGGAQRDVRRGGVVVGGWMMEAAGDGRGCSRSRAAPAGATMW